MRNNATGEQSESRVYWEHLEEWVRGKWERREPVDGKSGYRNGYGSRRGAASCAPTQQRDDYRAPAPGAGQRGAV